MITKLGTERPHSCKTNFVGRSIVIPFCPYSQSISLRPTAPSLLNIRVLCVVVPNRNDRRKTKSNRDDIADIRWVQGNGTRTRY